MSRTSLQTIKTSACHNARVSFTKGGSACTRAFLLAQSPRRVDFRLAEALIITVERVTRIYLTPGRELTKGTLKGRTGAAPRHTTPYLTPRRDPLLRHRAHMLYLRTVGRTYVALTRRPNDV